MIDVLWSVYSSMFYEPVIVICNFFLLMCVDFSDNETLVINIELFPPELGTSSAFTWAFAFAFAFELSVLLCLYIILYSAY